MEGRLTVGKLKRLFWITIFLLLIFVTIKSASAINLTNGFKAYYTFDNGNTTFSGASDPDMTEWTKTYNVTSSTGGPVFNKTGIHNEAWNYSTASSTINSGTDWNFNMNTQCGWINTRNLADWGRITYLDDARTAWALRLSNAEVLNFFYTSSGVNGQITGTFSLNTNQWYHICAVYNATDAGNELKLYVNGSLDVQGAKGGNLDNPGAFHGFGMRSNNYYFAGLIDEYAIWDRPLSPNEVSHLWNGGAGNFTWFKSGGVPPVPDDLNLSANPYPTLAQFNTNPVTVWATANASNNWTCRLYLNGTLNQTQQMLNGTVVNCSFQINLTNGGWTYFIRGNTSLTDENTTNGKIYFDNVNPVITVLNWTNGTLKYNTNITGLWNITDNFYLHRLNASIDGVQVFGVMDINSTQYLFNFSSNVSGLSVGLHTLSIQVADGHTANSIVTDSIDWSNGLFNDYLRYDFKPPYANTYLQIVNKDSSVWDSWKTTPAKDRHTFSFEPSTVTKTITLDVTSNSKISVAENDELTWLVFNNHWVDFAPYNVSFKRINEYYVQAIIQNPNLDSKLEFNSIGDLNIITRNYTFAVTNLSASYTKYVNEGSVQTIQLRIYRNNTNITNTSAALSWNGTLMNVTKTVSATTYDLYTSTFTTSLITSDPLEVFNFTWFYNITHPINNLTGNITLNQTVYRIGIDNCSTYTIRAINITIRDEGNNSPINGFINGYFEVWINETNTYRAFNLTWAGNSTYGLCINRNITYYLDGQMEYGATSYDNKNYYLNNYSVDNVTDILDLYLTLNTTLITLLVTDQDDDPVKDVFIHVQSYDLGTNSYQTTEIVKTDFEGQGFAQMIMNTQWYQFMLVYNGVTVLQTDATKIVSTLLNFQINLEDPVLQTWTKYNQISCGISFNNVTNNFRMDFNNPSSEPITALLTVYNSSMFSKTILGTNNVTAASGTLLVGIGATPANNTFTGQGVLTIDGQTFPCGNSVSTGFNQDFQIWGTQGIFYAIFIIIAITTAFIWGPEISVIATLVAVGALWFMGVIGLSAPIIMTILILGGIIVYRLTRK